MVHSLLHLVNLDPNNGEFIDPSGIDIDSAGNVYVTDERNFRVQIFAPQ